MNAGLKDKSNDIKGLLAFQANMLIRKIYNNLVHTWKNNVTSK